MDSDIREAILSWFKTQQQWVQIAAEKILTKDQLTELDLKELLESLKSSDTANAGGPRDLSFFSKNIESGDVVKLVSIGNIQGIDDLSPRTPLAFGNNLTVIYGHNGSGKSGYTRILKRVCGKPDAADLIPNIFKGSTSGSKCSIVYELNGKPVDQEWIANTTAIHELKGVDIFDSSSGGMYLERETEAAYLPLEVALFERLVGVYDLLAARLNKESSELNTKLPKKPVEFEHSKYIDLMYTRLKHDTDIEKLKAFYFYSEGDREKEVSLEERIKIAPSTLAEQKTKRKNQIALLLSNLDSAVDKVSKESLDKIWEIRNLIEQKNKAAVIFAKSLEDSSHLKGIGEDAWKSLWMAAKKYSEEVAYEKIQFPNLSENSVCVLCHQSLDSSSRTRLKNFSEYIQSQIYRELDDARGLHSAALSSLPATQEDEEIRTSIQACQLDEDKWLPVLKDVWSKISAIVDSIAKGAEEKTSHIDRSSYSEIVEIGRKIDEEILVHLKDAESFDLVAANAELNDLKAKHWAHGFIPNMIEEIDRLKKLNNISIWLKAVGTNQVSKKAGEISEKALTQAFVDRFNEELKVLGADKISIELVKVRTGKGKVKHRLQLKNVNPMFSKVQLRPLSDGEKRIVSLAAFLADMRGKSYKTPFVFDDPISSLDQVYEERAAQRLISLSKDRQVIIFTHRLSLLSILSDVDEISSVHIRRESWGCGEHGDIPLFGSKPINAIKKLKNERLAQAKRALKESGYEAYNLLAKSICSDFRIVIERIVETELLGGVVQRHQRGVTTKGKIIELAKIEKKDCLLIESLMSEYSKFEHSQSSELPVELPTPEVLDQALSSVLEWHSEFSKRPIS